MIGFRIGTFLTAILTLLATGCGGGKDSAEEIRSFSLDDYSPTPATAGVAADPEVTYDGGGSIRISVSGRAELELARIDEIDVEEAFLIYRAALRAEGLDGTAYLVMWCSFPGRGEFFSKGLDQALSGDSDWKVVSAMPFRLRKGENPESVTLNLYVEGSGTVWIDDIRLLRADLE